MSAYLSSVERLQRDWTSMTYAFSNPSPSIETIDNHQVYVFTCAAS